METPCATVEFFDAIGRPLAYGIPEKFSETIKIGSLVEVPVRTKKLPAIVTEIGPSEFSFNLKNVERIIYETPVLDATLLQFLRWVANYYRSPLNQLLEMAIPRSVREKLKPRKNSHDTEEEEGDLPDAWDKEISSIIVEQLFGSKGNATFLLETHWQRRQEIYRQLAAKLSNDGGQILFLFPRIRSAERFFHALPPIIGKISVLWHGTLTPRQRFENWQALHNGNVQVIVGTRSALFLPFANLRLIAVDEEESDDHWQSESPKFHCRDGAIYRAKLEHCPCILGSIAPSLESVYASQVGKFQRLQIPSPLKNFPKISIVDLTQFPANGQILSPPLLKKIEGCLAEKKKIILFHPQRGISRYYCLACGSVATCSSCGGIIIHTSDVGISVDKCSRCDRILPVQNCCKKCKARMKKFGTGTQKIEGLIGKIFPKTSCCRCDGDVAKSEEIIKKFSNGEFDILVGTTLALNGLDLSGADLLAMIDLDVMGLVKNFRHSERLFQQLMGIKDRLNGDGEMLLQTRHSGNVLLQYVIDGATEKFYEEELSTREAFAYPPFRRLVRQEFRHEDRSLLTDFVNRWAAFLLKIFENDEKVSIKGPLMLSQTRASGHFRSEIWLLSPNPVTLLKEIDCRRSEFGEFPKKICETLDVDPATPG